MRWSPRLFPDRKSTPEIQKKQEEYQQKELEIKQKNEEFITVTQDLESLRSGMNQSSE